jgi:phosphoglycerate-specific signal transduction histidine kinase
MLSLFEPMRNSSGELTVKPQLQGGQRLFSVIDTGAGLPTENVDQIVSAFYTANAEGSGMGLAISRSIVESLAGRLRAAAKAEHERHSISRFQSGDGVICSWLSEALSVARSWRLV